MSEILYSQNTATVTDIAKHLHQCNHLFAIPLDTMVDIDLYAKKIRTYARTFEAWHGGAFVGFLAMYENTKGNFCFVTMLSTYNVAGLGRTLTNQCIAHAKKYAFKEIRLEVQEKNTKALNMYSKTGFKEYNRKGDTLQMKALIGQMTIEKTTTPICTIIVLTYNHEDTIAKAIESILEQKTAYTYEIWLCEDCSTDDTLKVCKAYADKYPEKIQLFAQPINTWKNKKIKNHIMAALQKVQTRYFTILEGDDYWCDDQKLQIALDVLENNPAYVTFGHDVWVVDKKNTTKKVMTGSHGLINPITLETARYVQTSGRLYRTVVDFKKYTEAVSDIFLFYIMLDHGPMYYDARVMSVYNVTGQGTWSKLSERRQLKDTVKLLKKLNALFKGKYHKHFKERALPYKKQLWDARKRFLKQWLSFNILGRKKK